MLTKFRARLKKFIRPVARSLAERGAGPNTMTITGFVLASATPLATLYLGYVGYILFVSLSAVLDALDGEIARIRGEVSRLGAFLDSFLDRVSDVFYLYSLIILGLDTTIVIILIVLSILISYSRARAEGLGVAVEGVGLMERGERVLALVIIVALSMLHREILFIGSVVLIILLLYTLVERVYSIIKVLK